MQHQAQEPPETGVVGRYLAVPVQGPPCPLTKSYCSVLRLRFQSVSIVCALWLRCTTVKLVISKSCHLKMKVKEALFQVAVSPVCFENTLG